MAPLFQGEGSLAMAHCLTCFLSPGCSFIFLLLVIWEDGAAFSPDMSDAMAPLCQGAGECAWQIVLKLTCFICS